MARTSGVDESIRGNRLPRSFFLALLALVFAPAAASTQQSTVVSERPARLLVDFTAIQPDGTPIVDLQPTDVEVRINGRIRPIQVLRRVSTAPLPASKDASRTPSPPFGTNDSVASGRRFVFVIDEESLISGHAQLVQGAVDGLLAELTAADQAMVVALPFAGVKTVFTSDRVRIRSAIASVAEQGRRNETGSDLACRTRRFLESLDGFLQLQGGRTSPVTVVVFTAGLAAPRRDAPMALAPGMCELLVDHYQHIGAAAGFARANFFVVQPDDIGMSASAWQESISGNGYLGSDNPLAGIENLAGVTGAVRLALNGTGNASLLRVARESAAYFVAEIDRDRDEIYNRSRPFDVRVLRRDVTVRARAEITFTDRPSERVTRLSVPDLLLSREAYGDVRLRASGFTVRQPDGHLRVGIVVEPADPTTSLSSVGAVLIDRADVVGRWFAPDPLERPLLGAIGAAPGTYRLRVVAMDAAGRVGAAEDVLDVGLTTVGPLSLGSLMLGVSRHDAFAAQLQFSTEPAALASFDIYGGAAGLRMSAALEIAREPDGPAMATLPLALTRADDSRVVAVGAVPLGALAPGDYVVRGVVKLEDGTIGRVLRTLRKVQ